MSLQAVKSTLVEATELSFDAKAAKAHLQTLDAKIKRKQVIGRICLAGAVLIVLFLMSACTYTIIDTL